MALSPGTRLGPYEVTAKIGQGGMGEVYRARDTKLDRNVALKVLPDVFADDPERLARFQREAKVLASLNHPNIASIYGLEEEDGVRALVLELVEGPTLAERIAEGAIPVDEALPIAKQIADALEAAHEAGVIHRDLKPANVKVKDDGMVKVLDFGLAKALEGDAGSDPSESPTMTAAATRMGVIMGTAAYMSPEQARGKPVDKRADIWAFGVVLYEMLTGTRPFVGDSVAETLGRVIDRDPDWSALPGEIPPVLASYLRRCLEKDRKKRIRDIGDVRLALEGAFETTLPQLESSRHGGIGVRAGAIDRRPGPFWRAALRWGLTAALAATVIVLTLRSPAPGLDTSDWGFPDEAPMSFTGGSPDGVGWPAFSLSPRGDFFVYVAARGEGTELWYRSLMDVTEAHSIDGTEGAYFPMVSPDGEWVAFFSGGQLRRVPIGGGEAVALMEIVQALESGHWVSMNQILVADRVGRRIRIVDPTTRAIVSQRQPALPCQLPFVLANEQVLCNSYAPYIARALDRDSPDTRFLQQAGRSVFGSSLRFVSDGYLTFVTAVGALQIATFDPETLELGRPATVVQSLRREGTSGAAHYAVTPSGALVYAPGDNAEVGQLVRRVRGEGLSEALDIDPAPFVTFDLSPDGERLAAAVVAIDGMELRVYELRTRRNHLWLSEYYLSHPRWSPTGERLAVGALLETDGSRVIMVGDPSSGSPPDTLDFAATPSHFLSEDRLLVTAGSRGGLILDLSQNPPPVAARLEDVAQWPTVSPDGRWMAYTPAGGFDVVLEPFPDGGRRFMVTTGGGQEPVWLSSTELAYRRGRSWYTVSIDRPSESRFWFSDDRFLDTIGVSHAPSRDGGVLYVQGTNPSTASFLRIIPNWLEEAKRAADEANRVPS